MFRLRDVGSSPRVRGTHVPDVLLTRDERFIPACAGNASQMERMVSFTTVHPRVCGERYVSGDLIESFIGSSPRVRGTRSHAEGWREYWRFIPACAGNA